MPSDSKKKKEQQKKEARKKKDIKKPANSGKLDENDELDDEEQQENENQQVNSDSETNGNAAASQTNGAATAKPVKRDPFDMVEMKKHFDHMLEVEKNNANNRACTGVLASHPNGRDTHIHQFSLTFYGQEILVSYFYSN